MSDDTTPDVADLINQIQGTGDIKPDTKVEREEFKLSKEELEEFLLNNSGRLVKDSLELIDDIGQFVSAAPDSRDVEALAKLVGASATALDNLNKLHIANQKNKTTVDVKKMDIESKKALQMNDQQHKLLLNREELMNKLIQSAEVIEIEEEI